MKKTVTTLIMMSLAVSMMAQENGNRDEQGNIVRGPYETNKLFDKTFGSIAGGVNVYVGENDGYGNFFKRMAPAIDVNLGKWLTPDWGLRLGYKGIQAKGWTKGQTVYAQDLVKDGYYTEKFGVAYVHGDVMIDATNMIWGYKETRCWSVIPYLSAGVARSYGNNSSNTELAVGVGLLNNIRLSKALDLTVDIHNMLVNQCFDGVVGGRRGEGMGSLTIGLSYKFNRRGFKRVDYTPYENQILSLEKDNNNLASNNQKLADQNGQLADENEALRNREPETIIKTSASPVALFFKINEATLDEKEQTNLDFFVKHAIELDSEKIFTLIGSADKETGTEKYNQNLSEKRMQYVFDLLTNKYGIPAERLIKRADGCKNNRFGEPELNRVVIVE